MTHTTAIHAVKPYPTGRFPISESQDQEIGGIYVVHEIRATGFEALKFWKGRSGTESLFVTGVTYF